MRVMLVEDDAQVADLLTHGLAVSGHAVVSMGSAEEAFEAVVAAPPDALVVDRMLPGASGLELIGNLRRRGVQTPVLILSALDSHDDRILGLRAGADDYLVKPAHFGEFLARIEALVRRTQGTSAQTRLVVGALELDLVARTVTVADRPVDLTPREFRLLEVLMRAAGQPVTRRMLLEQVWGYHFDPQTNVIDVHMSRLRHALGDDATAPMLSTVRGVGYVLRAPGT